METISKKAKRGRQEDGSANPVDIFVGQKIKIRRQILHLSQGKLANLLGITFQQVQKYERGANRISASRIWDVANILGVDCNYFYQNMSDKTNCSSPRFIINEDATLNNIIENDPFYNEQHLRIINNLAKIKVQDQKDAIELITSALSKQSTKTEE